MRIHTLSLLNMVCFYALNSSYMLKILLFQTNIICLCIWRKFLKRDWKQYNLCEHHLSAQLHCYGQTSKEYQPRV